MASPPSSSVSGNEEFFPTEKKVFHFGHRGNVSYTRRKRSRGKIDLKAHGERLWYLDNMKGFLALVVVAFHSTINYWSLSRVWPVMAPLSNSLLGIFFFMSAYFTPGLFARKGAAGFCWDRFVRLGIPALGWYFLMFLLVHQGMFIVLWYSIDLLVVVLVYAAWRTWGPKKAPSIARTGPREREIWAVIAMTGTITAIVRMFFPVGNWYSVLWFFPMELANWPQHLGFFVLGLWAAHSNWLQRLYFRRHLRWFLWGLASLLLCLLYYLFYLYWSGGREGWLSNGGINRANIPFSLIGTFESMVLPLGVMGLFYKWSNLRQSLWQPFARNSYGIYCVHMIPMLKIAKTLGHTSLPIPVQYMLTVVSTVFISWAVSEFVLCRLPYLRQIFAVYRNAPEKSAA